MQYKTSPKLLLKENRIMKTAHYLRKVLFNSRTLLVASILALTVKPADAGLWDNIKESAKAWYADDSSEASDEPTIPQTPVEYAGRVDLILQEQIELAFDENTPGIGNVGWMGFSPEGTLLLTDFIGNQAVEFSRTDGQYIRSFGRAGSGPGEYVRPMSMDIDPQGQLYILDPGLGYLLRYDRQGQYLDQTPRFSKGSRIATGRAGEVFLTRAKGTSSGHIMELQRLDPATYEPIYRIPLSTSEQSFIARKMFGYARLAYSPTRHRLYYMGPNDYKVTEIDADTGRLVRQFGYQLERYDSLPERYYNLKGGTIEDMSKLNHEMSYVMAMILVEDRYVFVVYQHPSIFDDLARRALKWEGIVYDLKTPDLIKAYAFEEPIPSYPDPVDSSKVRYMSIPGNDLTHWDGRLYNYQSPPPERAEHSNGTVRVYESVFRSQ